MSSPSPAIVDGALAFQTASPTLGNIQNQEFMIDALAYPTGNVSFAGAFPDPSVTGITTSTTLASLYHIKELFKAFFAMHKLSATASPLANLYLRNKVDYHSVRLDTSLWMDWEYDRNVAGGRPFKAKLVKSGSMANFMSDDRDTIIGALIKILANRPATDPLKAWAAAAPGGVPQIKEFFSFMRDKLAKFFADTERIESEYVRVGRYVTAYIDKQIDLADTELDVGRMVIETDPATLSGATIDSTLFATMGSTVPANANIYPMVETVTYN